MSGNLVTRKPQSNCVELRVEKSKVKWTEVRKARLCRATIRSGLSIKKNCTDRDFQHVVVSDSKEHTKHRAVHTHSGY